MGRRYSFELIYPREAVVAGLEAVQPYLPRTVRVRADGSLRERPDTLDASAIAAAVTPDEPYFGSLALLFPAIPEVRGFRNDWPDQASEWDDEGIEYLPIGSISYSVRVGERYALFSYRAVTSAMSLLFQDTPAIWQQFDKLLQASGGLLGFFARHDSIGKTTHPLLPDGAKSVTFDEATFFLEERAMYWHIDTDRMASEILCLAGFVP